MEAGQHHEAGNKFSFISLCVVPQVWCCEEVVSSQVRSSRQGKHIGFCSFLGVGYMWKWTSQVSILCIWDMWLCNTKAIFKTNYRILEMTLIKSFFCGSMMNIPPAKSDCLLFFIVFILIEITLFEVFNTVGHSFFKAKIHLFVKQTLLLTKNIR